MEQEQKSGARLGVLRQALQRMKARRLRSWGCWAWALVGSIVIGVTLPTLLVCMNCGRRGVFPGLPGDGSEGPPVPPSWEKLIIDWTGLQAAALMFCGPGAAILAWWLFLAAEKASHPDEGASAQKIIKREMIFGAIAAFVNLPGLGAGLILPYDRLVWVRLPLLFIVAGASSGAWIGWQAWRSAHPEERLIPRFSLGTLLLVLVAWGALLAVFAPK